VRIGGAHLEEDAGKLMHEAPGVTRSIIVRRSQPRRHPLLEIVTRAGSSSPKGLVTFGQELQKLCQFWAFPKRQNADGAMRFEPNLTCISPDEARGA